MGLLSDRYSTFQPRCHFIWMGLAALMLAIGCGPSGSKPQSPPKSTASNKAAGNREQSPAQAQTPSPGAERAAATSDQPARISLGALQLPGNTLLAESAGPTWESEAAGDIAAAHLKELGEAFSHPEAIREEAIARLLSEDFRSGSLRPAELQIAFQDQVFTVYRPSSDGIESSSSKTDLPGVRGLIEAVQGLVEPRRGADDVRVEQKVVRVEFDDDNVETKSLVHVFAKTKNGNLQQNMVWTCRWNQLPDNKLKLASIRSTEFEEIRTASGASPAFADCTQATIGASPYFQDVLAYSLDHWLDRIETRYGLDPSGWQGIAVGDANGDGLDDVYVCQPGGIPNGLLVQSGDGTATNIAKQAGVDVLDQTHSALLVDLDNDGDQDLVLGISLGVLIFANDGQGRFEQRTAKLTPQGMPFSLSAADYDNDGDLDLYVCCYSKRRSVVSHQFMGRPLPYHDANNGARNLLLRNNRRWRFPDVTQRVGLSENNQRFSFAAAWEDYDNDGDLDLYVANDYGRNNLYRNDGGTFDDVAAEAGVEDISAGMSVSWGDVDNDGWMDLYVSNMFSSAGNRVAYQRRFQPFVDASTRADFQRHARGNSLFANSGNGTFRDVSEPAAVTMGRWAWGSSLTDLNNDGRKDIVVANGFLTQELPDDL